MDFYGFLQFVLVMVIEEHDHVLANFILLHLVLFIRESVFFSDDGVGVGINLQLFNDLS